MASTELVATLIGTEQPVLSAFSLTEETECRALSNLGYFFAKHVSFSYPDHREFGCLSRQTKHLFTWESRS